MKRIEDQAETLTITQAHERLGVSRTTFWRIMREYNIETLIDVLDNRVKRVRASDIERVLRDAEHVRRGLAA